VGPAPLCFGAGVPRVWEKIEEKLKEVGRKNTGVKRVVADWAKAAALDHHTRRMAGHQGEQFNICLFSIW